VLTGKLSGRPLWAAATRVRKSITRKPKPN